jgi:hypothetical protein
VAGGCTQNAPVIAERQENGFAKKEKGSLISHSNQNIFFK